MTRPPSTSSLDAAAGAEPGPDAPGDSAGPNARPRPFLANRKIQVGLVLLLTLISYATLYRLSVRPVWNIFSNDTYSAHEYLFIPDYQLPTGMSDFLDQKMGIDYQDIADFVFRPAFEIDRRYVRHDTWNTISIDPPMIENVPVEVR